MNLDVELLYQIEPMLLGNQGTKQPCQLCGQRIVRADRILPPVEEAVAQSSCLDRLIRTHVFLNSNTLPWL